MISKKFFDWLFPSKVSSFIKGEEARDERIRQMKAEYAFLLYNIKKNQERIEELKDEEYAANAHVVIDCGDITVVGNSPDQPYARTTLVCSDSCYLELALTTEGRVPR